MTTRIILLLGFSLITLHAGETSPEDLLRQGLFEEEANQDLGKATAAYQAVITAHERQRAFAATATFRLGEIARKKNDKEAAAAAFRTVAERFPEQQELARLSRENLAALGIAPAGNSPAAVLSNDPEDAEIARLKKIARDSPDLLDGAGKDGWRPLHVAASKGWTRVVSFLLENDAEPNSRTISEEFTPLQLASAHGFLGTVNALLATGADPDLTTELNLRSVKLLPVADTRVSTGDWNALNLAIVYNRSEIARALIEAKTDLTRSGPMLNFALNKNDSGTPLDLAIYLQRNDLANTLIAAGAPPNLAGKRLGNPPLAIAVLKNWEMIAPLLKAGADPNAKNKRGETPLHWASSPEIVELLVTKGADPNAKTTSGLTPLDVFAESDSENPAPVFEAFLKHGATVEDPIALLRRCSEPNLASLRELIVYPRTHRPDAILLSVSGYHPFDPSPTPTGRTPRVRVVNGFTHANGFTQARPALITLETRPSPASTPPSLAEALCETLGYGSNSYPRSIRILRRSPNEAIETVREWKPTGVSLPTDWPALEWGDIVEVNANNSRLYEGQPTIGDLSAQIPARNVTFRLGGLEIPQTIPGSGVFWLDNNPDQGLKLLLPGIALLADPSHVLIHRKGTAEPIPLDLSKPTETRFRLIDGDTLELAFNLPLFSREFGETDVNPLIMLHEAGGFSTSKQKSLAGALADYQGSKPIDFRKILILRRAENWKPEIVDFKATLDTFPQTEEWKKERLEAASPKLSPGDVIILTEDQTQNSVESATEILRKLENAFNRSQRTRIVSPEDRARPRNIFPQR